MAWLIIDGLRWVRCILLLTRSFKKALIWSALTSDDLTVRVMTGSNIGCNPLLRGKDLAGLGFDKISSRLIPDVRSV